MPWTAEDPRRMARDFDSTLSDGLGESSHSLALSLPLTSPTNLTAAEALP